MFCDGAMYAEAAFLEALKDVTRYRLRGNVLTLFAGRTAILKFEGTPLPEDQSGDGSSMSVSVSITDRKWILDAITGESVSLPENPAFIVFDGEQKRAGGNSACNNFGGSYTARDGKFSLSRPVSTMRACIEDGRSKVERGFLDALQKADRYYISGDKLTLYSGDVAILEFTGVAKDS